MTATREAALGGLGVFAIALGGFAVALHATPAKPCAAKKAEAAISARAAEICTGEFIGCSLSYAEVRKLVAEAQAAKACE